MTVFRSNLPPAKLPEGWQPAQLRDIASIHGGGRLGLTKSDYVDQGVPAYSAAGQDGYVDVVEGREPSIILSSIGARCGKSFLAEGSWATLANTQVITPDRRLADATYLIGLLDNEDYWNRSGSAQPFIKPSDVKAAWVPLPPLDEQRRIAEVLRSVDEAIAATQRTVDAASSVRQVALDAMIQQVLDGQESEVRPLSDVAEVRTGLAKNKNRTGPKVLVHYLRVANVQDGWFNLADMQEIEVDPEQVDRYLLQAGDVLLTEGGDYDKLGRGGVWHGEISPCLHQNHVFCVRPNTAALLPDYFALATQSAWGRAYFLTCAKRTTNLASINSSQLRAFPVPIVPTAMQAMLIEEMAGIDAMIDLEERQLETLTRIRSEVSSDLLSGQVRVPA